MRTLLLCAALVALAPAAELRCVGVLGNSGEAGATLVRFDPRRDKDLRDGLGVVADRFGTLWDRGGSGRLVRYALDGRALATVAIPPSLGTRDRLAVVGDILVLLVNGKLLTIDLAAAELKAVPAQLDATLISRGSAEGGLLVYQGGEKPILLRWNPKTGERADLPLPEGITPKNEVNAIELADGVPVARLGGKIQRLEHGTWAAAGTCGGDRLSYVAGAWWTGAYHGTVQRFDAHFAPDPGVVLGGASGSVIGHLDGNYELNSPTGFAVLDAGMYAIGGLGGVVHLASWNGGDRALTLVRRIGPVQGLRGHLAIDGQGRVHIPAGTWNWSDGPDAPLRDGTGMGGNGQVAVLANGALAGSAFQAGPAMMWGTLDKEVTATGARFLGVKMELPEDVVACTILPEDGGRRILRLTAKLAALESVHAPDGKPQKEVAVGVLTLGGAPVAVISLALTTDKRVLAGATGCILELERADGGWRERARTTAIAGEALAGEVRIAASDGRLWISDGGNHRVLVSDQALAAIQARFGGGAGDDLAHCDRPAEIAASGGRAVVYDAGNQRILKLELR